MGTRESLPSTPQEEMDVDDDTPQNSAVEKQQPLPTDANFIDTLEEPLQSIAKAAIPSLGALLPSAAARAYTLELQLRSHLLNQLLLGRQRFVIGAEDDNNADDDLEKIVRYWKSSLDLCVHLVHFCQIGKDERYENMSVRKLPLVLLEDVLDGLSISEAKTFWQQAVEPSLDRTIFSPLMWKQSNICHLALLKACNKFLRMLEDSGEWSGRVMWALSRGFGVADKSAMKLWGSFHTDNVTEYETEQDFDTTAAAVAGVGHPAVGSPSGKKGKSTKKGDQGETVIDYSLYHAFWSLQSDFSNPNRIQVADFLKKLRIVLAALESAHKNSSTNTKSFSKALPAPVSSSSSIDNNNSMPATPKYLTSSGLLPLQLATTEFRVHLVTQFLIVATHLSSESPPLERHLATLLQRAKKLLEVDAPEHLRVLQSIILKRELHWRNWKKNQKCTPTAFAPKYKTKTPVAAEGDEKKSKRPRLMDHPLSSTKHEDDAETSFEFMDRAELARTSKRMIDQIPSLENHLQPYVDALDPEAGIEDEYHPKNDRVFCWQAMRLFSRHHLDRLHLVNCRGGGDFERLTRHVYQDKGIEIPGEMPSPPKDELAQEEKQEEEEVPVVKDNDDGDGKSGVKSEDDLVVEGEGEDEVSRQRASGDNIDEGDNGNITATKPDPMEVEPSDADGRGSSVDGADVSHDEASQGDGSVDGRGETEHDVADEPQHETKNVDVGEDGEDLFGAEDAADKDDIRSQASSKSKDETGGLPAKSTDAPNKNPPHHPRQQQPQRNQIQQQGRDDSQRDKGGKFQGGGGRPHAKRGARDNRGSRRPSDDTQSRNASYQDRGGVDSRDEGRGGRSGPRFVPRAGVGGAAPPPRDDRHRGGGGGSGGGVAGSGGDRRGGRDDRDDGRWRRHRR